MILWLVVFGAMVIEARRAARNERRQLDRGGREPLGDVYDWMRVAYPAAFAVMLIEGAIRAGTAPVAGPALVGVGLALFVLGKALKWWAIVTLGPAWTFRVIVVPGGHLVTRGPYRFLRHPNYVGVAGELLGVALMTRAIISGLPAIVGFLVLIKKRIAVEEAALAAAGLQVRNRV